MFYGNWAETLMPIDSLHWSFHFTFTQSERSQRM